MKQRQKRKSIGRRSVANSPPSVVQLPGGVRLSGIPFRITERHEDGSPKTFEILPALTSSPVDCVLYANEEWIRAPKR